ncbi:hypothetical protein [Streptomyces sp. NPDC056061]|uniref:hypothetical protein n=1 Tax=Streptomyces sp. NPDC056061 TaxID=3345700 RepID=UPI0035E1460F
MTDYVATCRDADHDTITASAGIADVALYPSGSCESVYLDPADARTFARGILALADEIDGGEQPKAVPTLTAVKVGDEVRVVVDDPTYRAGEFVGATGRINEVNSGAELPYRVTLDAPHSNDTVRGHWWCAKVERLAAAPTDDSAPTPDRASYLAQARDLMSGENYTAADLIALADYLAG